MDVLFNAYHSSRHWLLHCCRRFLFHVLKQRYVIIIHHCHSAFRNSERILVAFPSARNSIKWITSFIILIVILGICWQLMLVSLVVLVRFNIFFTCTHAFFDVLCSTLTFPSILWTDLTRLLRPYLDIRRQITIEVCTCNCHHRRVYTT